MISDFFLSTEWALPCYGSTDGRTGAEVVRPAGSAPLQVHTASSGG